MGSVGIEKAYGQSEEAKIPGPGSIIRVEPDIEIPGSKDPWKHRSKGMKCATCIWFVHKGSATPTIVGRCRRHAPTMNGYPVVFDNDWCGDHKVDETKI